MELKTQLAKLIREDRNARGETQEQYSERFGVTRQLVYLWEHGLSQPNPAVLKKMSITMTFQRVAKRKVAKEGTVA